MKISNYKKLTPKQVQELLYMRKRSFIKDNQKAYNRKVKHKGRIYNYES